MKWTFVVTVLVGLASSCQFERVKPPNGDGCFPLSCGEVGASCGLVEDGCGGVLSCGSCASGEVCGSSGFDFVCCEPTTCAAQGAACGEMTDGCGGILSCGDCEPGETCGAAGPNLCAIGDCEAATCQSLGVECGTVDDSCSETLDCGTCEGEAICGGSGIPNQCGIPFDEEPVEVVGGCFGFPETPASQLNHARLEALLDVGDVAPDFTLLDVDGSEVSLYGLLETKPVLLQTGSYTCPVYWDNIEASELLAASYGDQVHFVVLYTLEAHPLGEAMPYSGVIRETEVSDFPQARTYDERVAAARALPLDGSQLLLIDDLTPREQDNPVWCTYATAPNAALLIDRDGVVVTAHPWFDPPSMNDAIELLLR